MNDKLTPKERFTVFIAEEYRNFSHLSGAEVSKLFKNAGIFDFINDTYEALHTEDLKFVLFQIDEIIQNFSKKSVF
jgi:hypothetical protein